MIFSVPFVFNKVDYWCDESLNYTTSNPECPDEMCRAIHCRVNRAQFRERKIKHKGPAFEYSGCTVNHGLHVLSVTAVLGAGRLKGSQEEGRSSLYLVLEWMQCMVSVYYLFLLMIFWCGDVGEGMADVSAETSAPQ